MQPRANPREAVNRMTAFRLISQAWRCMMRRAERRSRLGHPLKRQRPPRVQLEGRHNFAADTAN
jgi:hypothetical protein